MFVRPAERDIGRPLGDLDGFNFFAVFVVNGYYSRCQVNVALVVNSHTVGTFRSEKLFVRQCPIAIDFVRKGLFPAVVGNVKQLAIGSSYYSVWPDHVIDYADEPFAVW
ncbi:hypothetical protein ES703_56251 [subsurface metagenome]